jgi:hypothetical protein
MNNGINQTGGRCSVGALASGAESPVLSAFSSSSAIRHPLSVLGGSAALTPRSSLKT